MKTQEMNSDSMREVLDKSRKEGVANTMYREYLVGLTNSLLGTISEKVFTNALTGSDTTYVVIQDIRDISDYSYQPALTDKACSIILDSILEYYKGLGYFVKNQVNLEQETNVISIRVY